jgi:molecular chaperone GrpE (heat shock protein)
MVNSESLKLQKAISYFEEYAMTCYFRILQEIFKKAGIEVTKENRQELDKIIHKIVSTKYKDCPATGREVKKRIAQDEAGFVAELKAAWKKRV